MKKKATSRKAAKRSCAMRVTLRVRWYQPLFQLSQEKDVDKKVNNDDSSDDDSDRGLSDEGSDF